MPLPLLSPRFNVSKIRNVVNHRSLDGTGDFQLSKGKKGFPPCKKKYFVNYEYSIQKPCPLHLGYGLA